jgi:serine phosphatase RsbU (regulator of sigma subunit)
MWPEIIYTANDQMTEESEHEAEKYRELFTLPIAEGLYNGIRHLNNILKFSEVTGEEFNNLTETEKSFWYDSAARIPEKLKKLNLYIRPFEDFCRTCIITDKEIALLVQADLERYCRELALTGPSIVKQNREEENSSARRRSTESLIKNWNRFSLEINYLIPSELKKTGYEIIRREEAVEINIPMVRKLARAIHSKYLHEIRNQHTRSDNDPYNYFFYSPKDFRNQYISDFDELPDEIKYSNIDNAAHIPTKLLSVGYKIRPVKKGFKPVPLHLSEDEIETMSMVEHIRWSWDKRLNGWTYDSVRDETNKTHPGLIPYNDLSEPEKEKDRELVRLIPALLKDIDYEAYPVDTRKIRHLSYALKPQSSIHKILNETRALNDQIKKLVSLSPQTEEMVMERNRKIEEAIREVEGSYTYAQHIQETFLPDDLFVRECFPESFILFKPKDIVSGDFYFFSRIEHLIIFAAADCTGHGIPGALLSTIGYGILDQAVNEIKLSDPSYILYHLYSKIHRFLHSESRESGLSDDMDISLCILDIRTNLLLYSGVKNPLYHFSNGTFTEYQAQNSAQECTQESDCHYTSDTIQLNTGDTIYLFSDGYIDQFGGKNHKRYLGSRFKTLLADISEYPMAEQGDLLYEELEQWRDENHEDQTDDILVIGIRI